MCSECHLSINEFGEVVFLNDEGQWHCLDGPAIIYKGGVEYYRHGNLHRDGDKPAVIWSNGTIEYWVNGKRHRKDGPALIRVNGDVEYWENGQFMSMMGRHV